MEQVGAAEHIKGALHGFPISVRLGLVEQEAGNAVGDGIYQAAGMTGDGQRAEPLGVHLAQAAGFKTRWHQQKIAARKHAARIGFVEADVDSHIPWVTFGQAYQLLFKGGFTAADDGQAAAGFDDGFADGDGQVDTFLLHQSRDHGKQWTRGGTQAEHLFNVTRIGCFAFAITGIKRLHQMVIRFGIPVLINSVGDAAQLAPLKFLF